MGLFLCPPAAAPAWRYNEGQAYVLRLMVLDALHKGPFAGHEDVDATSDLMKILLTRYRSDIECWI